MKDEHWEIVGNFFIALGLAIALAVGFAVLGLFLSLGIEVWELVGQGISGFDTTPPIEELRREARP